MTNEKDYKQQFNECCANIVGLKTGKGSTSPLYFKDEGMHGKYECRIEDYVPYDSIDQLEKVVEILKSTLGITIDLEAQRRDGKLATYRSMVDDMLLVIDDCDNHPYETCAERLELEEMAEEFGTDVLDVEEGWDECDRKMEDAVDVSHGMYDERPYEVALRESTKRQFEHSLRLNMPYDDTLDCSKEVIKGCVGRERFWEDEDEKIDISGVDINWENDEEILMNDFTHVGDPRSIYWQAARILILAHYRSYDEMYVDMTGQYNVAAHGDNSRNEVVRFDEFEEDGLLQSHKIEAYIRNPDNCMEGLWTYTSAENPYILPEGGVVNLKHLHQHRLKIIKTVLEKRAEEYKSKEGMFNELCQRITKTANAPSYCIDASTFNPYQDILQLSRIVEIILGATGEPFVVDGQDGVDMMKEMREHVEVYSAEKYMTLEEL